jgi:predicted RNA-binding protein with TRAM domain
MSDPGRIRYLFTGRIEERDGSYVVEIPEREIEEGDLRSGEETQIGLFAGGDSEGAGTAAEAAADEDAGGDASSDTVTDATVEESGGGEPATGDGGTTAAAEADGASRGEASGGGTSGTGTSAGDPSSFESLDEVSLDEDEPPVSEGDTRRVEITDVGEQGDGLARIDRGYIVFVPETEPGDTVQIEITDAKENFGFGKVVE